MTAVPPNTSATTFTWLALVALSIASFAFSDVSGGRAAVLPILLVALLKSSLVGLQFMELRSAHVVWKTAFVGLLALIVLALWAMRPAVA